MIDRMQGLGNWSPRNNSGSLQWTPTDGESRRTVPSATHGGQGGEPAAVALDGMDIAPLLFQARLQPSRPFFYYRGHEIFACRLGDWKAHFITQSGFGPPDREAHDPPLRFHLGHDPSERFNLAADQPGVLARICRAVEEHRATVTHGEPQLH